MGGVAKHLNHVWENLDMTFGELKQVLSEASQGTLEVVEKFDGVNLHFRVDSHGMVRFARNDGHRKAGGMTLREMRDFFENHKAQETFVRGGIAICEALENTWWPLGFSSRNWVNCDIIDSTRPQLLHYDTSAVTVHEAVSFDSSGQKLPVTSSVVKNQFRRMVENLPHTVAFDGEEFRVLGPQTIQCEDITGSETYTNAMQAIRKCQEITSIEDEDTLREFAYRTIYAGVTSQINISEDRAKNLACLIVGYDSPSLVEIKKGVNKVIASKISAVGRSVVRGKIISEAMLPIEIAISKLGSKMIDGMSSSLIENPSGEMERIKGEYISARAICETVDDGYRNQRMEIIEKQVKKIELENYSLEDSNFSGFSIEGLVFERNGKKYKLTGDFAAVNQVVGIHRYGRGKIPAAGENSLVEKYILEGFSVG